MQISEAILLIVIFWVIYMAGVIVGKFLFNRDPQVCTRQHLDETTMKWVSSSEGIPFTLAEVKVGAVKRPSVDTLEKKRMPKKRKETEKAMEDTLDELLGEEENDESQKESI